MTGELILDLLFLCVSVLLASVNAIGEIAIDSSSKSHLEDLEHDGDDRAGLCLHLKDHPERLQASVQFAQTFLILFSSAVITPHVAHGVALFAGWLDLDWWQPSLRFVTFIATASLITAVFLLFGTLVARSIGLTYAHVLSLRFARWMHLLTRVFNFPTRVLTALANVLLRPVGGKQAQFSEQVISEENLMDIIEEGTKTGILDKTEHELIESILQFTDTTAREIMIPRKDIVAIEQNMSAHDILALTLQEGFTRMPVYRGTLDNIVGIVYAKDVISLIEHPNLIVLEDIIRPPFIVPETKPISELLRDFQRKRIHLAVVVDEFGGTEGLITLEDIIEEIVGEIHDEYDEESLPYDVLPNGVVEVEGLMNIGDFNNLFDFSVPESEDYDTIGGFITSLLGKIPEPGDHIVFEDGAVTVLSMKDRRVLRARFSPLRWQDGSENEPAE